MLSRVNTVSRMIPPGVSIIDLAAGAGIIRERLPRGTTYLPVDFSQKALDLCGVPGLLAPCTDVPVSDNSFHTVLCMEILEHLDQPHLLLLEACRIALHQVIVTVPNDRLPPEEFSMHRRVYKNRPFTDFLRSCGRFISIEISQTAANLVARCILSFREAIE